MRTAVALLAALILAWHGAVPAQTPTAPPASEAPNTPAEQAPVEAPATSALGPGLSVPTLAILGVIAVIALTTVTTTQCFDRGDSCGGTIPAPATATATGTR